MDKLINTLKNIREFFWPVLDPPLNSDNEYEKRKIDISDFKLLEKDNIDEAYNLALSAYDNEEKRRATVENKCIIFIGTVGLIMTISVSGIKAISKINTLWGELDLILFALAMLYFCQVGWFAVKALQVAKYNKLGAKDFFDNDKLYKETLIVKLINYTLLNTYSTNLKVDYMNMSQEYFKRTIVCIALHIIGVTFYNLYNSSIIFSMIHKLLDIIFTSH